MNGLRFSQPLPNKIEMPLRGRNSSRRLLLKCVQNIQHAFETHGVDGAIGVAVKLSQNTAAKALSGLATVG
jgi:hypothetical protein